MTTDSHDLEGLTKKERRELQREMARIQREADRRRRKRRKILGRAGLVVLVVAVIGLAGLITYTTLGNINRGPLNMASDGIAFTGDGSTVTPLSTDAREWLQDPVDSAAAAEGVVTITEYIDYGDPDSSTFDAAQTAQIQQWLTYGYVQLEVHPVSFVKNDEASNGYSSLAANAAACVAEYASSSFLTVSSALLAANPLAGTSTDDEADDSDSTSTPTAEPTETATADPESTEAADGVTSAEDAVQEKLDAVSAQSVADTVTTALGSENTDVTACITDGTYDNWVANASARAAHGPLTGDTEVKKVGAPPLVLVDGQEYTGALDDATAFITFISEVLTQEEAESDDSADDDSTATPEPTETSTEDAGSGDE